MAISKNTEFTRLLAIYVKQAQLEKGNGTFLDGLTTAELTEIRKQVRAVVKVKMEKETVECVERQHSLKRRRKLLRPLKEPPAVVSNWSLLYRL